MRSNMGKHRREAAASGSALFSRPCSQRRSFAFLLVLLSYAVGCSGGSQGGSSGAGSGFTASGTSSSGGSTGTSGASAGSAAAGGSGDSSGGSAGSSGGSAGSSGGSTGSSGATSGGSAGSTGLVCYYPRYAGTMVDICIGPAASTCPPYEGTPGTIMSSCPAGADGCCFQGPGTECFYNLGAAIAAPMLACTRMMGTWH